VAYIFDWQKVEIRPAIDFEKIMSSLFFFPLLFCCVTLSYLFILRKLLSVSGVCDQNGAITVNSTRGQLPRTKRLLPLYDYSMSFFEVLLPEANGFTSSYLCGDSLDLR